MLKVGDRVQEINEGCYGTITHIFRYPSMKEPYDRQHRIKWDAWPDGSGFSFIDELLHVPDGYDDFQERIIERLF